MASVTRPAVSPRMILTEFKWSVSARCRVGIKFHLALAIVTRCFSVSYFRKILSVYTTWAPNTRAGGPPL